MTSRRREAEDSILWATLAWLVMSAAIVVLLFLVGDG